MKYPAMSRQLCLHNGSTGILFLAEVLYNQLVVLLKEWISELFETVKSIRCFGKYQ